MSNFWDRPLKMYSNSVEYIIAYDEQDATDIWESVCGPNVDEDFEWYVMDVNSEFTMHSDDGKTKTVKTVGEWIDLEGRGFFASSEW